MSYRRQIMVVDNTKYEFTISIKMKVGFMWVTVWSEECRVDDADQIEYLKNCAVEVADKLIESV